MLHFVDRDTLEVHVAPKATKDEMLSTYPDAIAAEPIAQPPAVPLTDVKQRSIRAWLMNIGETESEAIAKPFTRMGEEGRRYPLGRATEVLAPPDDGMRACCQCANLVAGCRIAKPGGPVSARRGYTPVPDILRRCEEFKPSGVIARSKRAVVEVPANSCRHQKRPGLSDGCCTERMDLPPAYGDHHPLRRLPEEGGTDCDQFKERE